MQLYTINATPVRTEYNESVNNARCEAYPEMVSRVCQQNGIDGFTIIPVTGYWQGVKEVSYKIEVAVESELEHVIDEIAKELGSLYNQDAVMITYPDNSVKFIDREEY